MIVRLVRLHSDRESCADKTKESDDRKGPCSGEAM